MHNLERLLARNLGCSRAEAHRLIASEPGKLPSKVAPESLPFNAEIGGTTVCLRDSYDLMLNKPAGCVTALSDPLHATVATFVEEAPLVAELRPVGRLDLDTTGLLLWTTDGTWLHHLTHPRSAIPRCYHVALARPFQPLPSDLVLRDGHRPKVLDLRQQEEGEMHPSLVRSAQATTFASVTIAGGAYHEVRRIFAALGSHVLSLCRVSFGALSLPAELAAGAWLSITKESVEPAKTTSA